MLIVSTNNRRGDRCCFGYLAGPMDDDWFANATFIFGPPVSAKSVLPAFGSTVIHAIGAAANMAMKKRIAVRRVINSPFIDKAYAA